MVLSGAETKGGKEKTSDRRDKVIRLKEAGLSGTEIGKRVGVTKQRVSQILHPKPKPSLETKPVLRPGEVAQLLGIHINTVRRWSDEGRLKAFRISLRGDRRFLQSEIERFIQGD